MHRQSKHLFVFGLDTEHVFVLRWIRDEHRFDRRGIDRPAEFGVTPFR